MIKAPIRKNADVNENGERSKLNVKYFQRLLKLVAGFRLIALISHVVFIMLKMGTGQKTKSGLIIVHLIKVFFYRLDFSINQTTIHKKLT